MQLVTLSFGGSTILLVAVALLVGLLGLVALARRRSASRSRARLRAEATEVAPAPVEADGEVPELDLSPRVIAAYVRTLEATLGEQDERLLDAARIHAERVQCSLLAMRDRVVDQPGEVVMNRVEAALARLDSGGRTGRPLLAAEPSGSLPVAFAMVRERPDIDVPPAQEAEAELELQAEAPEPPVGHEPVGPAPEPADIDTAVTLHRVLPVPAPVEAVARSRSRRKFGRSPVS